MKLKKRYIVILSIVIIIISLIIMIIPWEVKPVLFKNGDEYRIVSYNLKYAEENDEFIKRKELMIEQLLTYESDFITVQEANYGWMNDIDGLPTLLNDYDYVGVGREDGDTQGEYAAIFYLKDKFEVVEAETIWLSKTPSEVSIGWDASTYRILTSATFKDIETGDVFVVNNTHLDHIGSVAKEESINLIVDYLEKLDYPYILSGDLNIPDFFNDYKTLVEVMDDSNVIATDSMKYGTVNYNFNSNLFHFIRIDYVLMSKGDFSVSTYRVDPTYKYNGKPISDHFPIIVDFVLNN